MASKEFIKQGMRCTMYVSILENNNNKTDLQTYYVIMSDVLTIE